MGGKKMDVKQDNGNLEAWSPILPYTKGRRAGTRALRYTLRLSTAFLQRQHRLVPSEEKRIAAAAREELHPRVALSAVDLKAQRQPAVGFG